MTSNCDPIDLRLSHDFSQRTHIVNDLQTLTTLWVTQRCFYSFQTFRRSTPSSVKIVFYEMGTVVDLCNCRGQLLFPRLFSLTKALIVVCVTHSVVCKSLWSYRYITWKIQWFLPALLLRRSCTNNWSRTSSCWLAQRTRFYERGQDVQYQTHKYFPRHHEVHPEKLDPEH